ncbi:MAG: hypothetical protein MMC23_002025 [Stictis urceolatum]|nr:hypothetical protein [Stictis urceolata]
MSLPMPYRSGPRPSVPVGNGANFHHTTTSWSKAVDLFNSQLTNDEKKKIDATNLQGVFTDLHAAANSIRSKVEAARYPWTPTLRKVIDHINHYAVVGDVIVQHHAEYTSLVWGTVRFLLIFAAEEPKTSEKIATGLHTVTQIVFRAEEYARLFSNPANSTTDRVFESLHENLIYLYAEVLSFLVRSTIFFQKSTIRRFASAGISSYTKYQVILDKINKYEKSVEKDKNLLESEARKRQEQYETGIWLQAADFATDLKRRKLDHLQGTCAWFFRRDEYACFNGTSPQSQTQFLWISGKPGCGKSVLAAQIIEDLSKSGNIVTYVFCKTGLEKRNTPNAILRNLLFQLLTGADEKPHWHRLLLSLRHAEQKESVECTEKLWIVLKQILLDGDKYIFVLDGIDECNCSKADRDDFVLRLTEVFSHNKNAQIISTSQLELPDPGPATNLWSTIKIRSVDVESDIRLFTDYKLNSSKELSAHPEKINLLNAIVANSDGMMLWANLMIRELEIGHWNLAKVLQKPPRGLSLLYQSILRRIFDEENTLNRNRQAIGFVLVAIRPLRREELALSIAVSEGLQCHEEYDAHGDLISEANQIITECSPLLTAMPDGTVQLVHSSLKQVLFSDPALIIKGFTFQEDLIQSEMASALLNYVSFTCFTDEFVDRSKASQTLAEYGSTFLLDHCTSTTDPWIAQQFVSFLGSTQGWRWVQRLIEEYKITFGHLQVWQSRLFSLMQHMAPAASSNPRYFLEITARKRMADLKNLPKDDKSRLAAMANLASTYQSQGRWKEAEELEVQVMETRKRVLSDEHPDTLTSMANLASTYWNQGRWKEAEELEVQVMETSQRVLGDEHPDTLTSMANLASTYRNQGRWKEAEELDVQVMETSQRVLGDEHPSTLTSMSNLASTYRNQGRWKEAEELEVQVMETSQRVLGDEHPDTLTIMANLASTYWNQGRWKEAEELEVQVMETRKRVLGDEHPSTLTSMANLASTYWNQGRWKEAEKLFVQGMETSQRVLSDEHPDTLTIMANLASTYRDQGRWKEAEELDVQVMETRKRVLGDEHPDTLTSIANLAWTHYTSDCQESAIVLMREVIPVRARILGTDHPETISAQTTLEQWLDNGNA